ncbi:MAG TPA: hypothetical protein VFQ52_10410 [Rhizomicrobium sp.]|nr:hypothetical protein [Rhizomicrobium sp.]
MSDLVALYAKNISAGRDNADQLNALEVIKVLAHFRQTPEKETHNGERK